MIDISQVGPAFLALSPDRKMLYLGSYDEARTLSAIDISTATAVVTQQVPGRVYEFDGPLGLSHDGSVICAIDNNRVSWLEISTSDLAATRKSYAIPGAFAMGAATFSPDDSVVYLTYVQSGITIKAFDHSTGEPLVTFDSESGVPDVVDTDPSGIFLFAGYSTTSYSPINVYYTGRPALNGPVTGPKSLTNVSTRFHVGSGDNVGIGGFIIKGQDAKKIIVRVIGPSLQQFGVAEAMADPVLELHDSTGAIIATNDNWSSHQLAVVATGRAPSNEHEAALVTTLEPGSYTAIARGTGGAAGVCLLEVYDLDPPHSRLTNVSSRGQVQTGDNVMIGGFIIGGNQSTRVIVRALGPSLADFGLSGVLADPMLEVHDGNGNLMAQNDDWQSGQLNAIEASGYAPPDKNESAILATLTPGNYTAIVRGKNGASGVALVDVYNLNGQ